MRVKQISWPPNFAAFLFDPTQYQQKLPLGKKMRCVLSRYDFDEKKSGNENKKSNGFFDFFAETIGIS